LLHTASDQKLEAGTAINGELSFQQAICYMSFRWVNVLHAWTVNAVKRLVKNPKTHYSNPIFIQA